MMLVLAQAAAGGGNESFILWGFLLLAGALAMLVLELFVPSGGLIGVIAGILAIASVVSFFRYDPMWGGVAAGTYIVLTPFVIYFMFKLFISSPMGKRVILGGQSEISSEETGVASEMDRSSRNAALRELIGADGQTATDLRPVGIVVIAGERIDALAENGVIDANTPVRVTDVYDNQIKVRAV